MPRFGDRKRESRCRFLVEISSELVGLPLQELRSCRLRPMLVVRRLPPHLAVRS
jgi:hypothetical protein